MTLWKRRLCIGLVTLTLGAISGTGGILAGYVIGEMRDASYRKGYTQGFEKGAKALDGKQAEMCATWWQDKKLSPAERIKQIKQALCKKQ